MKNVVVYVRVSILDRESGLASQKRAIQRWLAGHGIKKTIWHEDQISGTTDKRPGLEKLHRSIFNGKGCGLVTLAFDQKRRLRRTFDAGLSDSKKVFAIAEQFDFCGAHGELVAALLFALAKMSRDELFCIDQAWHSCCQGPLCKWTAEVRPLHQSSMSPADIARKSVRSRHAVHNLFKGVTSDYTGAT